MVVMIPQVHPDKPKFEERFVAERKEL